MIKSKIMGSPMVSEAGAIISCALWGISTPIVKLGYAYTDATHVPSLLLWAGIQFALAGLFTVCIYSVISKRFVYPKKENREGVALIAILQTVLQYACMYVGLMLTTSVKGAVLKSTDVFFVALIASLLFRQEKLTGKKIISCIIGFMGILVMNLDGLSLNFNIGDGLVVTGIVAYSFGVVITKRIAQTEDPIILSGYQMTFGGVIMLLLGAIFHGKLDFMGIMPIILGLSAIYAVSYTLWTVLLKYNAASSITIYSFMTPIFGVIFSAILLEEAGGVAPLNLVLALVLVCFGIILWGYEKKQ